MSNLGSNKGNKTATLARRRERVCGHYLSGNSADLDVCVRERIRSHWSCLWLFLFSLFLDQTNASVDSIFFFSSFSEKILVFVDWNGERRSRLR